MLARRRLRGQRDVQATIQVGSIIVNDDPQWYSEGRCSPGSITDIPFVCGGNG